MSTDRPWSPEAETSLVGALLIDPDALLRIADRRLLPGHLFDARNRAILAAVIDLHARRLPVDVVTVHDQLRERGQHDDAGGMTYLQALAQCVPSAAHIGRYADLVLDLALRRAIRDAADRALDLASEAGDTSETLDRIQTLFGDLRRQRAANTLRSAGDLIIERSGHWEALEAGTVKAGISTGLQALDEALGGGIKPGRNVVLAGRPGTGKTSLGWQVAAHVAAQGRPVLVLSMEMQAGDLMDRAVANLGRVPLNRLVSGRFESSDWARITEAADTARRLPLFVDDAPALSLLDIRAKARMVQQQAGDLALVVVDYLQLAAAGGTFSTRHHQIETISRGMKALAKELPCCVLLLSQLTRESERDEPELAHLKESGAIEEDADTVLLLHALGAAPEGGMLVLVKAAKNRQGKRGRFGLAFDGALQRWQSSAGDVQRRRGVAA